jgi:hypothetical protein
MANQDVIDNKCIESWYDTTPGIAHEVEFLGWQNRATSPIVIVVADTFGDQCLPEVIPRLVWDSSNAEGVGLDDPAIAAAANLHFSQNSDKNTSVLVFRGLQVTESGRPCYGLAGLAFSNTLLQVHHSVFETLTANQYAAERVRRELELKAGKRKLFVRLFDLEISSEKNGREGELLGKSVSKGRFAVVIGGKIIDVKPKNFRPVERPKLFFDEFEF